MKHLDENTLVAYADGELDLETTALVEKALVADMDAARTVRVLREMGSLVRAAHNSVVHENIPDRLIDVVMEAQETDFYSGDSLPERLVNVILDAPETPRQKSVQPVSDGRWANSSGSNAISLSRRRSVAAVAMAAAVASVLIGGGFFLGQIRGLPAIGGSAGMERASIVEAKADQWREAAFQEALGTKKSKDAVLWINPENGQGGAIAPVKTYKRGDGTYCRIFQSVETGRRTKQPTIGVACREPGPEGQWIKSVEAVVNSDMIPYRP